MPGDKRSFEERVPHVLAAEKLLCSGAKESAVVRVLGERFGLTAKQVRHDIAAARGRWGAKKAGGIGAALGMSVARRNRLYYLAVKSKDYRLALAVLDSADKLLGLYPKTRTVVVLRPKPQSAAGMTDAELERIAGRDRESGEEEPARPTPRPEPEEKGTTPATRHRRRQRSGRIASRRTRSRRRHPPAGAA